MLKLLRKLLNLNDDQRQNLTTFSMMGGIIALTGVVAGMVWIVRFSWPQAIVVAHAAALIEGLFWVTYGLLGLMAVQIIAQAVIAIGGKMKASLGAASIEAEAEIKVDVPPQ